MNTDDLVSTIEAPGEFDALTKLRPGEPYFALIGRDRLAAKLVLDWARLNRERADADHLAGRISDDEHIREMRKSTQAETVGWAMQAYKNGQPLNSPQVDRSGVTAEHYSGHRLDPETAERDKCQTDLIRASSHIHNAIAYLADAKAILKLTDRDDYVDWLRNIIAFSKDMANDLAPPRPGIPVVDMAQA